MSTAVRKVRTGLVRHRSPAVVRERSAVDVDRENLPEVGRSGYSGR
ncbi:hypothetical protein ACOT81_08970 [Streptomyces sp. WI04-05B]|nr:MULTISPECIES: hypothetical protein [unclassified Streptomyces]MDX2540869.1 hypothetical protein [Streptomyces sp. WI04-05B]MDX2585986.1 hypothetical protein [Streptomyces sp. WI04-05A]MDX3745980.1 hypothetical protein [Streptomyces sp. AK08-02]